MNFKLWLFSKKNLISSQTFICKLSSLIIPPLDTKCLPTSNCGLIKKQIDPPLFKNLITGGIIFFNEIKLASQTTKSNFT